MDDGLLQNIRQLLDARQYRIRAHCTIHMFEEGFEEAHLREALGGRLRILEEYPQENRCLALGYFYFSPQARSAIHIVLDLSHQGTVDVVTAYIPEQPWWSTPTQRNAS